MLIVDRDRSVHRWLRPRLEARGLSVHSILGGEETLARMAELEPDIVFLDLALSGPSGLGLLQAIRAQDLDIGVIVTTAHGSEEMAIEALRRGADDYLRKPFDRAELEAALDRTIPRHELARENLMLRRQLGGELARAAAIQAELLPQGCLSVRGFELAAYCLPARQVGGDFYDWQQLGANLVSLTVGDVMGKGMPAALLMATVRAVLRAVGSPRRVAAAVQAAAATLDGDLFRAGSFVTLFHAQLDLSTGRLAYVDAGHGYVLLRRADGRVEELPASGLPLGVFSDEVYHEGSVTLDPGDVIIIYSDGLTQACPDLLRAHTALAAELPPSASADGIAHHLIDLARASGPLRDDLTVAVLRRCQSRARA